MRSNQDTLESRMLGNLARPVWGWGPGAIPGPTPLFFGSPRGGRASAIIYSIIASARRHGLDVWQYLGDILHRLADLKPGELERLLPDVWQQDQTPATRIQPSNNVA